MKKGKNKLARTKPLLKERLIPTWLIAVGSILLLILADRYWLKGVLAASPPPPAGEAAGLDTFADLIKGAAGPLVGVVAVAAVVAGGIIYALSGGEPGRVKMAKNVIIVAISGLLLYIFMDWLLGWLGGTVSDYFSNLVNMA